MIDVASFSIALYAKRNHRSCVMKNNILLIVSLFFICSDLFSQPIIVNNGFETSLKQKQNFGWSINGDSIFWSIDTASVSGDHSLKIHNRTLMKPIILEQTVDISKMNDLIVDLSFFIKCENVTVGYGGIIINMEDKAGNSVYRYNMYDKKQIGTSSWHKISIPLFLEPSWSSLTLGPMLAGHGTVWYDNFKLSKRNLCEENRIPYFSKLFTILKKKSLYMDQISAEVEKKYMRYASYLEINDDVSQLTKKLFLELGDNHSQISNTIQKEKHSSQLMPSNMAVIKNNYGYLNIPPFSGLENSPKARNYISNLSDNLDSIKKAGVDTLILDLRFNHGGNMWPMLKGISKLLSEKRLGMFIYPDGKKELWRFISSENPYTRKVNHDGFLINMPVIVLIGNRTASSGEGVAIALKGRKNTFFIGSKTNGLATSRQEFVLNKGQSLFLTTCRMADADSIIYKQGVTADDNIVVESFSDDLKEFLKEINFQ